ncbi:MAG: phage holin family protein [Anaerolineaceae bacterium]|nr:phage holin family protein [Anaerolineaceae bacterium]
MENIRMGFVAVITLASQLCGGYDQLLHAMVVFVAIDYFTGVVRAAYEKKLNSQIGAWGIVRKVALFGVVAVANEIDLLLGLGHILRAATIAFFLSNEGISLLGNIAALGVPIPPKLLQTLEGIKDGLNSSDDKKKNK